jgi:hypothetical protein
MPISSGGSCASGVPTRIAAKRAKRNHPPQRSSSSLGHLRSTTPLALRQRCITSPYTMKGQKEHLGGGGSDGAAKNYAAYIRATTNEL